MIVISCPCNHISLKNTSNQTILRRCWLMEERSCDLVTNFEIEMTRGCFWHLLVADQVLCTDRFCYCFSRLFILQLYSPDKILYTISREHLRVISYRIAELWTNHKYFCHIHDLLFVRPSFQIFWNWKKKYKLCLLDSLFILFSDF